MADTGNLQSLFRDLARHGDAPALIAVGEARTDVWSYRDLADQALAVAGGLRGFGVEPGDPVGLFAANRPEWVIARLALIAAGALAVPIDDLLTVAWLAHVLADSGCRFVFTTRALVPALSEAGAGRELRPILLDSGDAAPEGALAWRDLAGAPLGTLPDPGPDAPTALFYTSGTTGPPKGVPLTHRNILANLDAALDERFIGPGDRVLAPLPFYHSYPFIVGMLLPLASGAAIVLPADVSGPEIVRALREGRASAMVGVPRLYEALYAGIENRVAGRNRAVRAAFRALLGLSMALREHARISLGRLLFRRLHSELAPRLRLLASGGARLEAGLERRLAGLGWKVVSGYGLVETASISTFKTPERTPAGSVGLPVRGLELRIDGARPGEPGEILLRGPSVFGGYRDDPAANRAAFTADGWFRTGDEGRLDDDGYLYITGRVKEMIVLSDGKNLAPEEVEGVYANSPYIGELAVLEREGGLVALVAPDIDAIRRSGTGRIDNLIRVTLAERSERLAPYQRVSGYALTRETLPRTRLGKFRRHELPAIYERALKGEARGPEEPFAEADRALLAGPKARRVWAWLVERFPDQRLGLDTNPQLDLGIDSLGWINLGLEIEAKTGVRLSEAALGRVMTLRDLLLAAEAAGDGDDERAQASTEIDERWLAPAGPGLRALGFLLYLLDLAVMRGLFRLAARGRERLGEGEGPLLVVCNHASDLDPLAVAAALGWRRMRRAWWGGDYGRLFATRAGRLFCRAVRVFPVDDRAPAASLSLAIEALRRGGVLIWFPEEWRSPDGRLQPFLPGVGRLVKDTGAAAVPVHIRGTFEAMPRTRRVPRPTPVRVTFGAPIEAAALTGHGARDAADIAAALHDAVAALASGERS